MQVAVPSTTTTQYQLALPLLLSRVSPGLASLHASRARLLNPTDTSLLVSHCSKCGAHLLDGFGMVRSVRKKRRLSSGSSFARVVRKSCKICGHAEEVPIETTNATLFPKPRAGIKPQHVSSFNASYSPATSQPSAPSQPTVSSLSRSPSVNPPSSGRSSERSSTPIMSSQEPSSVLAASRSQARSKKKSGLQQMLARNRERQEQEKQIKGQGISAFLQGL
ncbi:hypothetical protein A0H81_10008 [Grifola frondosa]|uniref:Uncharacterized protein n=1 Tax=Grifola frondosa TaxID=5627 RepID=A0A1C7M0H1_GRIFR|nr:hypothetical protein A0H81_10008 [Grifola frondosa]